MCLKRIGNWKSPGPDEVYGYWVKLITCVHDDLTSYYNLLFQDPDTVPDSLSHGPTTLIPKNDKTDQAKNYRPSYHVSICLVQDPHLSRQTEDCRAFGSEKPHRIGAEGCQQGSFGAKDQLLINELLNADCKTRHRSLSMAWVDC